MSPWSRLVASLPLILGALPGALVAQDAMPRRPLTIFLDCRTRCDDDFLRIELDRVNWVSDRTAADVHIIATRLATGAGGREVTLSFIGRGRLEGLADTVVFRTNPDVTDDGYRREFLRVLQLGLVRYELASGNGRGLAVAVREEEDVAVPTMPANDPWHLWVFQVGVDLEVDAESRQKQYKVETDLDADRTTEDWKIRLNLGRNLDRTTFTLDEGQEFTANRDRWTGSGLVVRSVSSHWSVGLASGIRSSKPDNLDLRFGMSSAIEWNLYPYAEATRRQLTFLYTLGFTRYDYTEETIFGKREETRADNTLRAGYETRQPWGTASLNGTVSAFLDDWSRNSLGVNGRLEVRLARGLEVGIEAAYSRIRDQITIPKGDATDQEIFLELRDLATDYRANLQVGLSYRFGSFFNTIVNPRFAPLD
jgi:hypothetical protein